jgi:predicted metal-dependent hydrolase
MLRARKPDVDTRGVPRHWFAGSPVATHIANGVNMLFPAGERFFVRSVNHFRERITDPVLAAEIRGFFGQEGRHAQAHEADLERLRGEGYAIDGFLRVYERLAFGVLEKLASPELNLAGTAAAEHFTALMAEGALKDGHLRLAHPDMRRLLEWHAAEEIEHKHVAFDVLQAVNPSYALRVAGLALATATLV